MLTFPYGTGGGSFAVSVYDNDGVPYSDPTPTGTGSLTNRDPGDLCSSCTFIEWGDLNANVQFGQFANGNPYDDTLQGFWIAGDMPTIGDLPLIGTATYAGTVYGTVIASGGNGSGPYTATGGLGMEWDFAQRAGTLEIVNFDNGAVNVSGTMRMPGVLSQVNSFSGPLNGTAGTQAISGGAAGSFVANGNDATAGVIGNWNVRNNAYRATGIFGGAGRVPIRTDRFRRSKRQTTSDITHIRRRPDDFHRLLEIAATRLLTPPRALRAPLRNGAGRPK